jgi:hypothetical protein
MVDKCKSDGKVDGAVVVQQVDGVQERLYG